jgi:hypothetical protein
MFYRIQLLHTYHVCVQTLDMFLNKYIPQYVFCWLQIKVVTRAGSGSKTPGPKSIIRD